MPNGSVFRDSPDVKPLQQTISFETEYRSSKLPLKCTSLNSSGSLLPGLIPQIMKQKSMSILEILKQANSLLHYVALASTLLVRVFPHSFMWFTSRHYAPTLGFFVFAVGVNSSEEDFNGVFNRPAELVTAYVGQFVVKPLLGCLLCIISVNVFGLPTAIGTGIVLLACVSGVQLSSYAAFLSDLQMEPDYPDVKPLQRKISFETGMQSSLLALTTVSAYVFDGIFSCSDLVENKEQDKTRKLKKILIRCTLIGSSCVS